MKVNKAKGDEGEDFVHQLSFNSFLKYWCYPNPLDINGDKKEICDLLIAFRNSLLIISVKNHNYDGDYEKYKRKVIEKSSSQLNGAYRKLFQSQKEIFLKHPDREPELFQPKKYTEVFRITINVGEQFEHYELGEYIEKKGFINILNKDTFVAIIQELDTIKDFVEYLKAREQLLLSDKKINFNCSEKDLLSEFLVNVRSFPFSQDNPDIREINLNLAGGWETYNNSKPVKLKREADRASYFIDDLVKNDILKLPNGEVLARELMNTGRTERRLLAKSLFDLVAKFENKGDVLARRYSVYNGIGHLFIYYTPDQKQENIDWVIQRAMELYAYKRDFKETEIIVLAATQGLKQWKFGMYQANPDISAEERKLLDALIEKFGWFKNIQAFVHEEKEYPSQND